jgi:hypothetical protein
MSASRIISYTEALNIVNNGNYYTKDANNVDMHIGNIVCDYCNTSKLVGAWKLDQQSDVDLCMNCFITLRNAPVMGLSSLPINPPKSNLFPTAMTKMMQDSVRPKLETMTYMMQDSVIPTRRPMLTNNFEPEGFIMSNKKFYNLTLDDQQQSTQQLTQPLTQPPIQQKTQRPLTRMCQDSNTKYY